MIEFVKIHQAFKFEELDKKAKDRVRESRDSDWDSYDSDRLKESMASLLEEKYPYFPADIAFDLSYSQGSGVSFHGDIDLEELSKVVDDEHWLAVQIALKYDVRFYIVRTTHHYVHWNTIQVEWESERGLCLGDYDSKTEIRRTALLNNLRDWLQAESKTACQALETQGYKEIEYKSSDEAIQEDSEANGWLYTKAGDLIIDAESDCVGDVLEVLEKDLYRQAKAPNVLGTREEVTFLEARAMLSEVRNWKL